jgi:5-methylcytosine-specific restriction protein B
MTIPSNISKEHLIKAIEKIDKEGIPKDADSKYYDVVYNGKNYPPKVIVSYANIFANGSEINRNSFSGGIDTPCFKLLEENGFEIIQKKMEQVSTTKKYWIEKTIVTGRPDRNEGERALGRALWSPQKSKDGADIYKNMRSVQNGDIVLHLINNKLISGISVVKKMAIETKGVENTEWGGPAYLIELEKYTALYPPIDRKDILNEGNKAELLRIANFSEVFFNSKLDLRQGAYLTPCSRELLTLINKVYFKLSANKLPFTEGVNFNLITSDKMDQLRFNFESFQSKATEAGLIFSPQLIQRFVASLCTKPFVICSGLSGSGKTKLAQAFAQWITADESEYLIVPVGADWTNREPLLGYPNALQKEEYVSPENGVLDLMIRAKQNIENTGVPTKPYFLILDEMNLSHVERYFADFLSTMESGDSIPLHKIMPDADNELNIPQAIKLPKNLFIIGTVNIDETTYMFSPKVLDRANTIEFRLTEKDLEDFIASNINLDMNLLKTQGANMSESFMKMALQETDNNLKSTEADLILFFTELKKSGAEFGYRTASEIGRLMYMLQQLGETGDNLLDIAIMQKLLPKLHGSRNKLTKVLPVLGGFCLKDNSKIKEDYLDKFVSNNLTEVNLKADSNIRYKVSFEKICRMYKNAVENGFASYAEA